MKILGNGRVWGSGAKIGYNVREGIIKLLRSSDLPMRTIAQRFGICTNAVSAINVAESIRPKGFRPERIF